MEAAREVLPSRSSSGALQVWQCDEVGIVDPDAYNLRNFSKLALFAMSPYLVTLLLNYRGMSMNVCEDYSMYTDR